MKLNIEQSDDFSDVEITIKCGVMDEKLAALVGQIRLYGFALAARRDGRSYSLSLDKVFYIESVDEKTFVYTAGDVYDCDMRLYELEEQLAKTAFCRVSKSAILNTDRVESVRSLLNGRMEVLLENGEKVLVSRHYVAAFKAKFGLG